MEVYKMFVNPFLVCLKIIEKVIKNQGDNGVSVMLREVFD